MSTRALSLVPAIAVLLLFGCDSELDRPVEFVIPEGFTGAFVLISCADYPDHIEKLSERYRLSIPADGVFRTRDTSIFSKWHTGSAIFAKTRTRAPLIASYSGGFGDKRKTPCVWS